jgi:hypothetical protein
MVSSDFMVPWLAILGNVRDDNVIAEMVWRAISVTLQSVPNLRQCSHGRFSPTEIVLRYNGIERSGREHKSVPTTTVNGTDASDCASPGDRRAERGIPTG